MRKLIRLCCSGAAFVVIIATQAAAQESSPLGMAVPLAGQPDLADGSKVTFPGDPVLGEMSLASLWNILGELVNQKKSAMRGAKEIAIFREAAPAVVFIQTNEGFGSGVVLQNGMILTNRHVVEGVGNVQMFFKPYERDGKIVAETRKGTVKSVDPRRDLALIETEALPKGSGFLKIASASAFDVGDDVYAIGHPLGYSWTFTQGIISGVRDIDTKDEHYTAIQTQTPINPGNSGGPLLNSAMEVVGINTWGLDISKVEKQEVAGQETTVARPAQGLNFAVSAPDLRGFVSDVETGKLAPLPLQLPASPPGCNGQIISKGRNQTGDAELANFSLQCDGKVDAWEIFPDDKSKSVQYHLDPDRRGFSSIVVYSDPSTNKWAISRWDIFRDRTFAVIGYHDDGTIQPTRFEYFQK